MKRKCLALLACLFSLSAPSFAQQPIKLALGHGAAPDTPRHEACLRFAEIIKQKTGGRYEVHVAPSFQLGNNAAMLTSLRAGTMALSANGQGPTAVIIPEFSAIGLPFLFSSSEKAWKLIDGPIGKELAEKTAAKGIVMLGFWDNGIRHMTNSKHPIRTPADVKGLKFRISGDPMVLSIVQALGASGQDIKFSEIYAALKQGEVDGQENPLSNIASAKFYEVQPYLSLTGHTYSVMPFMMSKRYWDRMSSSDQKIFQEAANEITQMQRKLSKDADDKLLAELKAKGMKVDTIDRAQFMTATKPVYDQWLASPIGDFVKRVIEASKQQ